MGVPTIRSNKYYTNVGGSMLGVRDDKDKSLLLFVDVMDCRDFVKKQKQEILEFLSSIGLKEIINQLTYEAVCNRPKDPILYFIKRLEELKKNPNSPFNEILTDDEDCSEEEKGEGEEEKTVYQSPSLPTYKKNEEEEGEGEIDDFSTVPKLDSEYEKFTRVKLLEIYQYLEKDEYLEALNVISKMDGNEQIFLPLKRKIEEKREMFDIMTEIEKRAGRLSYRVHHRYNRPEPDPKTIAFNSLDDEEKLWYKFCFRKDSGHEAPISNFETLFDLIQRHPTIGRKKLIQMYFFGEYFGVNDITDENFLREGLGFALEQGRVFVLSLNFKNNNPSEDHPCFTYRGGILTYVDSDHNKFTVKRKGYTEDDGEDDYDKEEEEGEEGEEEEGESKDDNEEKLEKEEKEKIEVNVEVGSKEMEKSSLRWLYQHRPVCIVKDEYDEEEDYCEDEENHEYNDDDEEEDDIVLLPASNTPSKYPNPELIISPQLLQFFTPHSPRFLQWLIERKQAITLGLIFSKFPDSIAKLVEREGYKSMVTTPLFFKVLSTRDENFINGYISGFGNPEASENLLLKSICNNMVYEWWGGGGTGHVMPLVSKIFFTFHKKMKPEKDVIVSLSEMAEQESKKVYQGFFHDYIQTDIPFEEEKEEEEEEEGEEEKGEVMEIVDLDITVEDYKLVKEQYLKMRRKKYEEVVYPKELKIVEERKEVMKRLFRKLARYLDWNASETFQANRSADSEEKFMESVIRYNDLEIAKFLIEDLMVEKEEDIIIEEKLNYFNLNDLKLSGWKAQETAKRRRKYGFGGDFEEKPLESTNETYEYVKSMRTLWNPANFKFFPREYQHVVCLFVWCLEMKKDLYMFLPPEMVCFIFQFIGIFDFPYILGKRRLSLGDEGGAIIVWDDPLPDFKKFNLKCYFHEIVKIKDAAKKHFVEARGNNHGLLEFKGFLEFCIASSEEFFSYITLEEDDYDFNNFEESNNNIRENFLYAGELDVRQHFELIYFVHHLKKEMYHRRAQEMGRFVGLLVQLIQEGKKWQIRKIQDRIDYEREHQSHSRYRRPRGQCDWISKGSRTYCYYSMPVSPFLKDDDDDDKTSSLENCVTCFLEFVRNLK